MTLVPEPTLGARTRPTSRVGQTLQAMMLAFRASLFSHRWLIGISLGLYSAALLLLPRFGLRIGKSSLFYFDLIVGTFVPVILLGSLVFAFGYILFFRRGESPVSALIAVYKPWLGSPARYANAVVVLTAMSLGFIGFSELKPLIPELNPYSWDVRFMQLDRWLHVGRDPWTLLQPLFGAGATQVLNLAYKIWFFVMFGFWTAAILTLPSRDGRGRADWARQFTLASMLCWAIGGLFLATVFSSMGPAFYDLVGADVNPFAAQMAGLQSMAGEPLTSLRAQDALRIGLLDPENAVVRGISAMPSMHNATSVMFMLAAFRIHRIFGCIMAAFAGMILIASVHLGWHYAIDGYAGIAIAWGCWALSGRILKQRA